MKALTICQPYPELILLGEKPIENREWVTSHRGQLLIHAGKSKAWMTDDDYRRYPNLVYGAIVGRCDLVACLELDAAWPTEYQHLKDHEHANGPFCLVLENIKRFARPIPAQGALGLWRVPIAIQPMVREQLKAVAQRHG